MAHATTDIMIIGAGLVGTSFALALPKNFRVQILEQHLPTNITNPEPHREILPITLSYSSQQILKTLNIWKDLESYALPIPTIHISSEGALGTLVFEAQECEVPALGYVLPFHKLQETLYHHAAQQSHIEWISIQAIKRLHSEAHAMTIDVEMGNTEQHLSSRLIVAADGTQSTIRDLLKISVTRDDQDDVALTYSLECATPHRNIAYERFTNDGTLALLPLMQETHYRCVWSTSKIMAARIGHYSDAELCETIQKHFRGHLGKIIHMTRGKTYPLTMQIAKNNVHDRCVLLGNSAHTLYPVAAQGFNLGLRNAAILSEVLADARPLKYYQHWIQPHQKRIIGITNGIAAMSNMHWLGSNCLRGLGLLTTDLFPPIKKQLAKRLLGLSGRLPKLAMGITLDD